MKFDSQRQNQSKEIATMRIPFLSILLVLLGAWTTLADDKAPAHGTEVTPLVGEFTRVVVCVDLKRVDVDEIFDSLTPEEEAILPDRAGLLEGLGRGRATLLEAGIERVYFMISLAEMPLRPWYLVAPCPRALDLQALITKMPTELAGPLFVRGELVPRSIVGKDSERWLFLGAEEAFRRLEACKPRVRPELSAALAESGDSAVRILVIPHDDDRRVIEELLPTLPEPLGGGSSTVLTRGLRWASVQIDIEPEPSVRVVIQSSDDEAAEQFRPLLIRAIMIASQQKSRTDLMDFMVDLAQVTELFPEVSGDRLVLDLRKSDGSLKAVRRVFFRPVARHVLERTATEQLKEIVRGIHCWHHEHKSFPAQANYDSDGKPLLSWRVHILPFLGETCAELHGEFRTEEPWDSEHNVKLLKKMPEIYAIPGSQVSKDGRTCYVRPVGPGTSCPPGELISFPDIPDGSSNTVAVIEVDDEHAVPWTKPADLDYDPENPTKGLGGHLEGAVFSAFCDGAPHVHRELVYDPQRISDLRRVFTRADGEPVNFAD
jgi:uncharacterized protein DUF1559